MDEMVFENKVVVFGNDHCNALGVIRSLGEAGVRPYAIFVGKRNFCFKSRYLQRYWYVEDRLSGLNILHDFFENENTKTIVIPTGDDEASILDLHYEELKDSFYVPNAGQQGRVTHYMNKEVMRQLAEQCGIKTPKSWVLSKNDIIPEDIIYPCITKSLLSIWGGKKDIFICKNRDELCKALKEIQSVQVQVQECLEKKTEILLMGCSLEHGHRVVLPGSAIYLRLQRGNYGGYFMYSDAISEKVNLKNLELYLQRIGYEGFFSIEFLVTPTDELYFMEINLRNDGYAYSVTVAGINLPYVWCSYCAGMPIKEKSVAKTIYAMNEYLDYEQFVATKKITLWKWLFSLRKIDVFLYYNKRDMMPFFYALKKKVLKSFKRFGK